MLSVVPLFGPPAVLNTSAAADTGFDNFPQLTTDGQHNWMAVWQSDDSLGDTIGTDSDILFARSLDDGQTWSDPQALNINADTDVGNDEFPQLTTDSGGNWVAVWNSDNSLDGTIGTDMDILFARSTDVGLTWTAPQPLDANATIDTDVDSDLFPKLTTDGLGNWVATWQSNNSLSDTIGTDSDILFARSTDAGQSWSSTQTLNTNATIDTGDDFLPTLTTDGLGNWMAVWQSDDSLDNLIGTDTDILFTRSVDSGLTWSDPQALNANAPMDSGIDSVPQLAADGQGNWVAVWDSTDPLGETTGEAEDIFFTRSEDNGQTWSSPQLLNTNASTDSRFDYEPQVTTDRVGNWVVVWYSSETLGDTIGTDSDILYTHSTDGGKTWLPTKAINDYASTDSSSDFTPQLTTDGSGNWVALWNSSHDLGGTIGTDNDILFTRAFLEEYPFVTVTAIDPDAAELGDGVGDQGMVRVERTGATDASLVVDFAVSGTATRDADYRFGPLVSGNRVTIPAGQAFVDVAVDVLEDGLFELTETVVMTAVSGVGYQIGSQGSASVDIVDDDMEMQIVSGTEATFMVPVGEAVSTTVQYSTSDNNPALTTFGLRMHFDSNFLNYGQIDNLMATGLMAMPSEPMADTEDFDNDPNTDSFILVAWADMMGNWPGEAIPADLFTAQFTVAQGVATGASTQIRFSASDTTFGYTLKSTPIQVVVAPTGNLDVDLDGEVRPATDGILVMRYLFGFTGSTLIDGAHNPAGGRTDPVEIVNYLDSQRTKMLDVDGDEDARASTDGILILRYLFGFTGETLTNNVVNPEGVRATATEIVTFLDGSNPTLAPPMPGALPSPDASSDNVPFAAAVANEQIVYADPASETILPGDPVSVDVIYTTSNLDDTLSTFGLRMHYNSTLLSSTGLDNLFTFGLISDPSPPTPDTNDLDADPLTDTYILFGWTDMMGNWPGTSDPLPLTLFTANFTAQPDFVDGTSPINFSNSDTTFGWDFSSTPAQITVQGSFAPTAVAGGPYTTSEGQHISLDGSASSDSDGTIVEYLWDLDNDGQYDDATGVNPIISWSALNALPLPADGIPQTIGLRVEDGDGMVDTNTTTMTIQNVAPTVDVGVDTSISNGVTFTRSGSFTDPGPDTWTAVVDYNDGSGVQTLDLHLDKTFDLVHDFPAGEGSYTVIVTIEDSDGGSTIGTFVVNVGSGEQIVTPNPISQTLTYDSIPGGDPVSFDVVYTTLPEDPTLSGLGLRMYFDSSKLTLDNLTNVLGTSLDQTQDTLIPDTADDDQDPNTDQYILVAWTDSSFNWPGTLPITLFTANFIATPDQVGSTAVNFSASSIPGGWTFSSVPATIEFNNRPVADAGGPYLVDEGGSVELDATASTDLDQAANTLLYQWDLDGDGLFGETGANALHGDETGSQPIFSAIGRDGPSTLDVALRVADSQGVTDQSTATVTLQNVAPTVNVGLDAIVPEGVAFTQTGSFTDPGLDVWTAMVDYGDGSVEESLVLNSDKSFDLVHVYPDNGEFTITVTVSDVDSTAADSLSLTVLNVVPAIDAGLDATINEGDAFTQTGSFTDPGLDTWDAMVNYGDGSVDEILTFDLNNEFNLSHTYLAEGVYTVTVTVTDDDAGSNTDTLLVTVQNVVPVVDAGPDVTIIGATNPLSTSGQFTDPGLNSWTATVDYGDGSAAQTLTLTDKTFVLDHVYPNNGSYTVTVTVTDNNGGIGTDTINVNVFAEANLDVDGDGTVNALTDGILILRHLFGFTEEWLVEGSPFGTGATRTDPIEITDYLDIGSQGGMLDVDANGANDALSDGMLILRYMHGFRDNSLIESVLGTNPLPQRTDPTDIVNFLHGWNPTIPAPAPLPLPSPDAFSSPDATDAALSNLTNDDIYSALAYEATAATQPTPDDPNTPQSILLATYDEWN